MEAKKGIDGRKKGSKFERDMCKAFSAWTGLTIDRTFMSGGGAQKGDIAPANDTWDFCVELKNRESWNIYALISGKCDVLKWWAKICKEADDAGKAPILVIKKNFQKPMIMVRGFKPMRGKKKDHLTINGLGYTLLFLDDFFENYSQREVL